MNLQKIEIAHTRNYFVYQGKRIFEKDFLEVLEFQHPGVAAVKTETGWFHIDTTGSAIYNHVYERTFGFYCDRAAVQEKNTSFHIDLDGLAAYKEKYFWCGNYQEGISVVKDFNQNYFHIDLEGNRIYREKYKYTGDFKEAIACICLDNGYFTHIDRKGVYLHGKFFRLLDVYHKGFARAMDEKGWFHIDRNGNQIYTERYSIIEPFYNGFAFCVRSDGKKINLNEEGKEKIL